MTMAEAIEILHFHYEWLLPLHDPRTTEATRLGVEALKQRQQDLQGNPLFDGELLPGETED